VPIPALQRGRHDCVGCLNEKGSSVPPTASVSKNRENRLLNPSSDGHFRRRTVRPARGSRLRLAGALCIGLMLPLAACAPPDRAPRAPAVERMSDGEQDTVSRPASAAWPMNRSPGATAPPAASHPDDAQRAALGLLHRHPATSDTENAATDATDDRPHHASFGAEPASTDAHRLADWVIGSADNHGLPFIVVDKKQAEVFVFGPEGRLRDASPALLGLAHGDDSVPGIGRRPMADIGPGERTTPAGRFVAELGVNSEGEDILWVDYDAAISMHRVRATNPVERRLQRLASATANDNRISYGCINLPAAFYDLSVKPAFAAHGGIVYVLPETRPLHATFPALKPAHLARR
jgi:hypothetical protein